MSVQGSQPKTSSQQTAESTSNDNDGEYSYLGMVDKNKKIKIGQGVEILSKNEGNKNSLIFSYTGNFCEDKRSGDGVMIYKNGDICLSQFVNDTPEGKGFYFWCSTTEMFEEAKDNDKKKNKIEFNNAFYGEYKNGNIYKGLLFSNPSKNERIKEKEKIDSLYYGSFISEGKKDDKNGLFLDLKNHIFLKGKFVNNLFEEGYELHLDQNLKIEKTFYIIKDKNKIKEIFFRKALDENEVEAVENLASKFIEYYITGDKKGLFDNFPEDLEIKIIFEEAFEKAKKYILFDGVPIETRMKKDWDPYINNEKLSVDLRGDDFYSVKSESDACSSPNSKECKE